MLSLSVPDTFIPLTVIASAVRLVECSFAMLSGVLEVTDVYVSVWVDDSS